MYRNFRIQPVRELVTMQDAMDRLFNEFITDSDGKQSAVMTPRSDVKVKEDSVDVKMSLPGVDKDDIDITVADDILTVKAEVRKDKEEKDEKSEYQMKEHLWNQYYRQIALPVEVEADKAKADYVNGVLKITLPKAEILKPKKISISAGENSSSKVEQIEAK